MYRKFQNSMVQVPTSEGFGTLMCADMITYTCKIINEKNYNYSHIKFNYQLKNRINSFHKK